MLAPWMLYNHRHIAKPIHHIETKLLTTYISDFNTQFIYASKREKPLQLQQLFTLLYTLFCKGYYNCLNLFFLILKMYYNPKTRNCMKNL